MIKRLFLLTVLPFLAVSASMAKGIDRKALVARNNPVVTSMDTLASLSVGNGHFAVTTDATGMQTFPEYYRNGVPLGTQSDWGWHSFGNPDGLRIEESYKKEDFGHGHKELYATEYKEEGRARQAAIWYRENPHRLHLGCNGLEIEGLKPENVKDIRQKLDMWTGQIGSRFKVLGRAKRQSRAQGSRFEISAVCHPEKDIVAWKVVTEPRSKASVFLRFPYPTGKHSDDACNWNADDRHSTELVRQTEHSALLKRTIDNTIYYVSLKWEGKAVLHEKRKNYWVLSSDGSQLTYTCEYLSEEGREAHETFASVAEKSRACWQKFWSEGAAVDFSQCRDKRAKELERRVVLSQYLLAIQCCGNTPPQETGLTYNSWFGKFHMEMIWWHQSWLPLWGHADKLDRTLRWYGNVEPVAREIAMRQGFKGVRWMKMTDPSGEEAPSKVGSYLIWQQPHLIYLAELVYRSAWGEKDSIMERYARLIDETADFMADFATFDKANDRYILKGIIPAQETLKASVTYNPPFELAYWYFGLKTAQKWRERRGLERNKLWDDILQKLSPLAKGTAPDLSPFTSHTSPFTSHISPFTSHISPFTSHISLYLAAESAPDTYSTLSLISDHPAVLGAVGILPLSRLVDASVMKQTAEWIWNGWNWDKTWGWDYPMVAMNAARLGESEKAVDALLMDKRTNTYLVNGHNYQDGRLRCYLPGNGGLLTAIALMCAGWDGCETTNPGFPKNGQWNVQWEGLQPLPE